MGKNNGIFLNLNFRDNSKLIPNNIAKNPIKEAKLIGGNFLNLKITKSENISKFTRKNRNNHKIQRSFFSLTIFPIFVIV